MIMRSRISTISFLVVYLISAVLALRLMSVFLTPIVLSCVVVSGFYGYYHRMNQVIKNPFLCAFAFTSILVVLFAVPIVLIIITLSEQSLNLYASLTDTNTINKVLNVLSTVSPKLEQWLFGLKNLGLNIEVQNINGLAIELAQNVALFVYRNAGNFAFDIVIFVFDLILCVFVSYLLFIYGYEVKNFLLSLIPIEHKEKAEIMRKFQEISYAVFVGNGAVSLIEGVVGGFAFYWFQLGPSVFWGAMIALAAFIPAVGVSIIVVPAALVLGFQQGLSSAVIYLVYNVTVISILELIVKNQLIGGKTKLPGILVFMSVISGVYFFGILGFFYGPLVLAVFISLSHIYKTHYAPEFRNFLS